MNQKGCQMKFDINLNWMNRPFDFEKDKLVCIGDRNHFVVQICAKRTKQYDPDIAVARIKLHDRENPVDAQIVFEDALKFGNEICKRWNEKL